MTLMMYDNAKTLRSFLTKVEERHSGHFHTYLLTIDFAKNSEKAYLHRFQALKSALDYVYKQDSNYIALAREEKYGDGKGYHIHAVVVTTSFVNFTEFYNFVKTHSPVYADFNMRYVQPTIKDMLQAIAYVVKNKKEVEREWGNVIETVSIGK